MGNSTKELVNAFNLNNYACDKISTNFTVEGKKIVGLFASSTNIGEYLQRMEEKIIKRHYGTREIAGKYYHLNCFPFVLGANPNKEYLDNGIMKVKLADSTNNEVIRNLKVHFANEFERAVGGKVVARLQEEVGITEDEAYEWIKGTVKTGAIGKPYLYCIAFSDEYLEEEGYSLRTFELFKTFYIREFNSRLENCDLKSSDFYEYKNDMLYIKNIGDKVVRSVAEYVKKEVALDFRTPGTEDSKVENFKDVLGDFIFKWAGKSINAYEYDVFTDKKKIENGNDFVLIPLTKRYSGQLESLKHKDAYKINTIHKDFVSDIRGKTAKPDVTSYENPVYAISNKRIAQLLPEIMQSPIAYNQINGRFEFAVDLENFKRRGSSRSSSTVTSPFNSPTHAEPPRTPPEQTGARFFESEGDRDSGIGDSPPKPKDSGSSSGGPGPSTELSYVEWESPTRSQGEELGRSARRGSGKEGLLYCHVNPDGTSKGFSPSPQLNSIAVSYGVSGPSSSVQSVSAAQNVRAGTSAWDQPIGAWSSPVFYAQSSDISVPRFQPPTQLSSSGPSLWKDAAQNVQAGTSQPMNHWSSPAPSAGLWSLPQSRPSSWKGASERRTSDKPLTEEEKELFKELLYTLNLTNYTFDGVYTNFFAKGEKIVSLLHDNVDREKYLQEVKASIIEKCCETEEEARELYDLDEFPFKLNCEEKQGKTVVANISRGALSNLKILFSQKFGKNVDAIDISAVKKVEKREKDGWVDRQLFNKDSLEEACEGCFPDEEAIEEACQDCFPDKGAMKMIPIAFEGSECVLDRSRDTCEVNLLLREQLRRFRGLTEEEENLFKALLYAFNYSNNNFDLPDTNFIVKNGKIVSLINDDVDVKEYLKEVRGETIKEYCVNEEEAYDLNEFPFKFLSNCEKNQETTVVANISRGALFNLKEFFISWYGEKWKRSTLTLSKRQ